MIRYLKNHYYPSPLHDWKYLNDSILKHVESKYPEYGIKGWAIEEKRRTRSKGAWRNFKHSVKDRFPMLLVYYKLYITPVLYCFLFDLDQSNVHNTYDMELVKSCLLIFCFGSRQNYHVSEYLPFFSQFLYRYICILTSIHLSVDPIV